MRKKSNIAQCSAVVCVENTSEDSIYYDADEKILVIHQRQKFMKQKKMRDAKKIDQFAEIITFFFIKSLVDYFIDQDKKDVDQVRPNFSTHVT